MMKTKKTLENGMLSMLALLAVSSVVIALGALQTYNGSRNKLHNQHEMVNAKNFNFSKALVANNLYSDPNNMDDAENSITVINSEISRLEQEKAEIANKMAKAKAERNKSHAMVAGMYFQPSQGLAEVSNLESKIAKLDHRIAALQKYERNLAENHDCEIQRLGLR